MAVRQIAVGQGSVLGLCIRSSALPSAGITKRSHFAAQAIRRLRLFGGSGHSAAQDIRRLRTFGVLADSTLGVLGFTKVRHAPIGKLFPDNS